MVTKALFLALILVICFQNTIATISENCVDSRYQNTFDPSDTDKNGLLSMEEFCSTLEEKHPESYDDADCRYVFLAWEISGDGNMSCRGIWMPNLVF